jgi:hypothetical protein
VSKVEVNINEVAKLRRDGATWQQVRDALGIKLGSDPLTARLNEANFDAAGVKKGTNQKSKARTAFGNGGKRSPAKGTKKPAAKKAKAPAKRSRGVTSRVNKAETERTRKAAAEKRSKRAGRIAEKVAAAFEPEAK